MTSNRSRATLIAAFALASALHCREARAQTPPAPEAPNGAAALDAKIAALFSSSGLTADVVAEKAQATSFDVKAKQADVEAASALVNGAILNYLPRVKAQASYLRLSHIDPPNFGNLVAAATNQEGPLPPNTQLLNVPFQIPIFFNQVTFEATLDVPISDYFFRISQQYGAASHSQKAAKLDERATRLKVGNQARVLYYSWARAKFQIVVATQALEQANQHAEDARHRFAAGTSSKADVLRVESQVASSRLLLDRAKNLALVLEMQLRTATHDPNVNLDVIGEDLSDKVNPVPGEADGVALLNEAMTRRLEIRALDETAWSLKDQAKVARAGYLPRLDGLAEVLDSNLNPRIFPADDKFKATWYAGGALTWTLNDIASSAVSASNLDAKTAQIEAQKEALREALGLEMLTALQSLRDAESAIETTAQGLTAAEESYRVRRELFRNAQATSAELTDAETDLTRARLESINARVDLRIARARLLHAIGRDIGSAAP